MTTSGLGTRLPRLSYLVRDDLLQVVLGHFTERTGVNVWFQDASGYTIAPETHIPPFCSILINHGRCGLANLEVAMPADPALPQLRMCIGGIGHVILPITTTSPHGVVTELGRLITEPLAVRETEFAETFEEARRFHIHPDNLVAAAAELKIVNREELTQLTRIVGMVVSRLAGENSARVRNLAVAEAFEEVGLRGNRDIINELLVNLVHGFMEADATVLTIGESADGAVHQAAYHPNLDDTQRQLLMTFTNQVVRWISQTGYPISFPDLGGSAWCRHVLGGQVLEGSLAAVPVKMPGDWKGWWTTYHRTPVTQMEDQLHRLSVMAAQSAQTLTFLSRLEASQEAALTDSLTGLHNRRFLREQLDRELARSVRSRYPVSMVIFDLDDFKTINDTYGHLAGDAALRHVASVLSQPLRRSSTICRYGGDEFCVVVPECGPEDADLVAHRLKEEIEEKPLVLDDGVALRIRISGGVATQFPDHPLTEDLFDRADRELIRAKREGKNRILSA